MNKLVRLAVSGLLLGWIGWHIEWASVGEAFARLQVEFWLAALGLLAISQVASTVRWKLYTQAFRFERSFAQLTGFAFIGMYFNLLLPTSVGGDVVRVWYLDAGSGRKGAALASVFLDRLNGLLVLVALAGAAVLFAPPGLPKWAPLAVWGIAGCGALGVAALPLALWSGKLPDHRERQLRTMLEILKAPKVLAGGTVMSLFVQVANVILVWMIGLGLGADVPAPYYWVMVPLVSLLTLLPISVNGMGVREGGVALFLMPLGVARETALALSLLWFAVHASVSLLGGLVYLFGKFPKPETPADASARKDESHGPIHRDSDQGRARQFGHAA